MPDTKISKESMREFWTKGVTISGERLRKILNTLKWDLETFHAAYRREISGADDNQEPEPAEIEAVTRFEEDGDYEQLLLQLGTSHPLIADSVVSRVIRHKHVAH